MARPPDVDEHGQPQAPDPQDRGGSMLPADLRASLRAALISTFGAVAADVDINTVGLDLLEGVGHLLVLREQDIHSSTDRDS